MKLALIQGTRICEIVELGQEFPVAPDMWWVDVPTDTTTQDTYENGAVVKFQPYVPTPLEQWEQEMKSLDAQVTERMIEDIYDAVVSFGGPVPQAVADTMTARKAKRTQRPSP